MRTCLKSLALMVSGVFLAVLFTGFMKKLEAPPVREMVSQSPVYIEASSLDLGEVWEQSDLRCGMKVVNSGQRTVIVSEIYHGCGKSRRVMLQKPVKIEPGETREIGFNLNLSQTAHDRAEYTSFSTSVQVQWAYQGQPSEVRIATGTATARIRSAVWTKAVWHHGVYSADDSQAAEKMYLVHAHKPLKSLEALPTRSGWGNLRIKVAPYNESGDCFAVFISMVRPQAPGTHVEQFRLRPTLPDGNVVPDLTVSVETEVRADIVAEPAELYFGAVDLGQTATADVTVFSLSGKRISIDDVYTDNDELTVTRSGAGTFTIRITPNRTGERHAKVTFQVTSGANRGEVVLVATASALRR